MGLTSATNWRHPWGFGHGLTGRRLSGGHSVVLFDVVEALDTACPRPRAKGIHCMVSRLPPRMRPVAGLQLSEQLGRVDVLVRAAGIAGVTGFRQKR